MLLRVEGRLILKDAALRDDRGRWQTGMALVVADGQVVRVDRDERLPMLPGDWGVPCRGRAILPGRRADGSAWFYALRDAERGGALGPEDPRLSPQALEALFAFGLARAALEGVCAVPSLDVQGEPSDVMLALGRASKRLRVQSQIEANRSRRTEALVEGGPADLLVLDALPLGERDLIGLDRPAWVVARGEVVVREGRLVGAELLELARDAAAALNLL